MRSRAAVIASAILVAGPAAAQPAAPLPKPEAPPKAEPPPVQTRPMSMQPGVVPRTPKARPAAAVPLKRVVHRHGKRARGEVDLSRFPIAGAPSFHRFENGVTRISLEVDAKVDIAETKSHGKIVFRLRNTRAMEPVNRLPLITAYFPTPVDRAQLVQDGADVELVIEVRAASEFTHRVVETPRGIALQIDFPKPVFADRPETPNISSRERARRRTSTQSLGADRKVEPSDREY